MTKYKRTRITAEERISGVLSNPEEYLRELKALTSKLPHKVKERKMIRRFEKTGYLPKKAREFLSKKLKGKGAKEAVAYA